MTSPGRWARSPLNTATVTPVDPIRLSKTMAFLLRHRPDVGGLTPDEDGWVQVAELATSLSKLLSAEVDADAIRGVSDPAGRRFELEGDRVRAVRREGERRDPEHRRVHPPDILYHATTDADIERVRLAGQLSAGGDRLVYLSSDESHAWRVAHRMSGGAPRVLYVDASRARRHGVRFFRNRKNGLFLATPIAVHDILNLQENFAEQISAGGIPVSIGPSGPRMALIRVTRKSGVTWEVAKGKLEDGEPPERAAVREVQEEMGLKAELRVTRYVGAVRYGFLAPGGLPRLKTVHLFLMEPTGDIDTFVPAEGEGIGEVRWFSLEEACAAVTHSSLVPLMQRARLLVENAAQPDPG